MSVNTRQRIRTDIRHLRRAITASQQTDYAFQLAEQCQPLPELTRAKHVALYLATDGELDTQPLIDELWQRGINTYLPVIHPFSKGQLLFLRYHANTLLVANQYRILEPELDQRMICPVRQLDIIFTPLVAFDEQGQRLGMGGGYYDRTLAPWQFSSKGPQAIGLAHNCQQVSTLPNESWDIPLSTIVTPKQVWRW
ncbi:5-formyltetrahydrofolate cyclo-ligase [Vibrio sp. ZSDZ65]|uniref:5-formyltetrahydrofolate cyclo-ligase n=1 Tax=Vibrio qingdaonensis TaxID=2829491 RepID=A0A9X3CMH7_9VIBR|nr:5-formyltetrahydrofolate cyclo-ligase [Vibrio qingdaonensis]MCW8345135.1 5-formyltetrahydrofolate cyclo-ligase [Vibrio qingdaonensis]